MGVREWFRAWASPQAYRYDTNEAALRALNDSQLAAIIESPALYDAQGRQAAQRELEARKGARGSKGAEATKQVQGILVLTRRPLSNSQTLLQQIVDQQRTRGYSFASDFVATVRVDDPGLRRSLEVDHLCS